MQKLAGLPKEFIIDDIPIQAYRLKSFEFLEYRNICPIVQILDKYGQPLENQKMVDDGTSHKAAMWLIYRTLKLNFPNDFEGKSFDDFLKEGDAKLTIKFSDMIIWLLTEPDEVQKKNS